MREQALLCPGCGHPRDETMDKDAYDHYKAHVLRCHACAARDRAAKKHTDQPHDSAGLMFGVERID